MGFPIPRIATDRPTLFIATNTTENFFIAENMEAEIMQVVLEEARESYSHDIVHEVPSNTIEDMENNVARVEQWGKQWLADRNDS